MLSKKPFLPIVFDQTAVNELKINIPRYMRCRNDVSKQQFSVTVWIHSLIFTFSYFMGSTSGHFLVRTFQFSGKCTIKVLTIGNSMGLCKRLWCALVGSIRNRPKQQGHAISLPKVMAEVVGILVASQPTRGCHRLAANNITHFTKTTYIYIARWTLGSGNL